MVSVSAQRSGRADKCKEIHTKRERINKMYGCSNTSENRCPGVTILLQKNKSIVILLWKSYYLFFQIKAEESNFGCLRMDFNHPHSTFPIKPKPTNSISSFSVRKSTHTVYSQPHTCACFPLPQSGGTGRNTLLQDKRCLPAPGALPQNGLSNNKTVLKPGHQLAPNSAQRCSSIRSSCIAPVGLKFPSPIRQDTHMSD